MPWLKASAAMATSPQMDIESTHQRLARDLDLELPIDVLFLNRSTAVGTLFGQRHIDDLVGFLFRKWAVGFGAIAVARLAARLLGVLLHRSLGERSGLAFLRPRGLLQELLQLRHALLKLGDPPFEPGTIGTSLRCASIVSHDTNIGNMAA